MEPVSLDQTRSRDATAVAITGAPDLLGAAALLLADAGFAIADDLETAALAVVALESADPASISTIARLAERQPDLQILAVVPDDASNASLRRALVAGARGLLLAGDLAIALVATARAMLAGQLAVPTVLGRQIAPRPLSHREREIIGLVVLGLTNREIADRLFLAESTVKTHLSSAFRKLDARSRAEAVARITDPESGYGMGILATPGGAAAATT
jgi:DNA-binding NarL/FixJ family response regulator